jgi:hypothetical protein
MEMAMEGMPGPFYQIFLRIQNMCQRLEIFYHHLFSHKLTPCNKLISDYVLLSVIQLPQQLETMECL